MIENRKQAINLSADRELPFVQNNKSEIFYSKKIKKERKSIASIVALNESQRLKQEFKKIYRSIKQNSVNKTSTTNLLEEMRSQNREESQRYKQQKYISLKKYNNTEQSSNVASFSQAIQALQLYPKKVSKYILDKTNKYPQKLKPINNYLMKRLQTDYLNVQKIKMNYKNMRSERNNQVILGIRSCTKEIAQSKEETLNGNSKNIFVGVGVEKDKNANRSRIQKKQSSKQYLLTPDKITKINFKINQNSKTKYKEKVKSQCSSQQLRLKRQKREFVVPFQTYHYRDMLWKVNYSNQLLIQTPLQYEHRLKVYIGKGNNSYMIRGLINRRIWFAVTDRLEDANFVWTQLKMLSFFSLQPNKKVQNIVEDTYNEYGLLTQKQYKDICEYKQKYRMIQQKTDEKFPQRYKFFKNKLSKVININEIKQTKMHNHLKNNYVIGNKKALLKAMTIYYKQNDDFVFNHLPYTYHIANGLDDQSYFKFLRFYYQRGKQLRAQSQKAENMWIVKPGQNSNRGYGIKVCKTLQEIKSIIKEKQKMYDGTYRTYIVQIYLNKPLLYHKRKFDLRHYMMVTCVNGVLKGYWYRDGYVRTSSSEYTNNVKDGKVHLTNDAIQKQMPDYGKYEKGNKISYQELHHYISKHYGYKTYNFKEQIIPKMKKIATDVVKASSGSIDPEFKGNNFQIFGLDFMIDSDFNVWLIEVNTNPCYEISCPLLGGIIPKMIENALQLTLDTMFPPPVRYTPKGVHYFKKLQEQNRFDLIYDSRIEGIFEGKDIIDSNLLEDEDETFEDDGEEWCQD